MIRITILGPAGEGRFYYRIDTESTRLATPLYGLAANPARDAYFRLRDMGAANHSDLENLIGAKSATPEAAPPPPRTHLAFLDDTGPGLPKLPKQVATPRKRKRVKSGGRRGQR